MPKKCKMCGSCCKAICIPRSPEVIENTMQYRRDEKIEANDDIRFISEHWTPISVEEALIINPYLQKWVDMSHKINDGNLYFYTCKEYNEETHKCNIHNDNPQVCRNFPYYGRKRLHKDELMYSEKCVYNNRKD